MFNAERLKFPLSETIKSAKAANVPDVEKAIGKYLAGAVDREGGRRERFCRQTEASQLPTGDVWSAKKNSTESCFQNKLLAKKLFCSFAWQTKMHAIFSDGKIIYF